MTNWNLKVLDRNEVQTDSSNLQGVSNLWSVGSVIAKGQGEGNEETTAADNDQDEDSDHVLRHHAESD